MIMRVYGGVMTNKKREDKNLKELLKIIDKLPQDKKQALMRMIYFKTFMEWLNGNKM